MLLSKKRFRENYKVSGPWPASPSAFQSRSDGPEKVYEDNQDAYNKIKESIQHG
jgi:hypothetical protein